MTEASAFEQVTRTKVENLEEDMRTIRKDFNENNKRVNTILEKVRDRPSWWTTAIITAMASALGALSMVLLSQ